MSAASTMFPRPSGIITLCTDFGVEDPYVGIMKGAVARASSKVQVVDSCHAVPAHDLAAGAFQLWAAIGRFPGGTVHVGVVDPGVGTSRRLLAISAHGDYWLVPDNGLGGVLMTSDPAVDVRQIDCEHLGIRPTSDTFHGRDVLAPAAAWLAAGRYGFSAMGPRVTDADGSDLVFGGGDRVVHVDRFGNLISNVLAARVTAGAAIRIADTTVPLHRTYGDVEQGELVGYVGSFGLVEVAAREASAAARLGVFRGAGIDLQQASSSA